MCVITYEKKNYFAWRRKEYSHKYKHLVSEISFEKNIIKCVMCINAHKYEGERE